MKTMNPAEERAWVEMAQDGTLALYVALPGRRWEPEGRLPYAQELRRRVERIRRAAR